MDLDLPEIGLGTAHVGAADDPAGLVATALDVGYRFVDSAERYGTERAVGEGIRRSPVPREDVVVATKIDTGNLGFDDVLAATRGCLDRLGLDAIDLLYVHWPTGEYDPAETMAAFAEVRDRGWVDHVGVSNFPVGVFEAAREACPAPVVADQVEMHPLCPQSELVAYAQANDRWLVAYGPLVRGEVFDVPELSAVADRHGVSAAQVSLAWLQHHDNVVPIPGVAADPGHLRENYASTRLDLDADDLSRIDAIPADRHRRYYPDPRDEMSGSSA